MPKGAWDTHFHALGPQHRFPYATHRKYTPPDAPVEQCLRLHDALGIERGLVVHANTHGFDNSVDLDAVARSDGRYYAVVRLDESATLAACRNLHTAGARGVRFAFNPQHGGTLDLSAFNRVLAAVEGLGWFIELHFDGEQLPSLHSWLESIPANVVIDHFGRVNPAAGMTQEPFAVLLELARRKNFWIKISGSDRISRHGSPYLDVVPFAQRLADVAPERLLWGTDWPHTGYFDPTRMPDDSQLVEAFIGMVPNAALRQKILVENPKRLLALAG